MMGSLASEKDRQAAIEAQVPVTLTQGFWMLETEVTQAMWTAVMSTSRWNGQQYLREGAKYPATNVHSIDAMQFCTKLTEAARRSGALSTDQSLRLPTEAQWEYACRAGTKTTYSFGNDAARLNDYAWHSGNSWDIGERYAHEVGLKKPNLWGLRDMHGNAYEWCGDMFADKLPGGVDPRGPASGEYRVLRGGSWNLDSRFTRSAGRSKYAYLGRDKDCNHGFRVVCVSASAATAQAPVPVESGTSTSTPAPSPSLKQASPAASAGASSSPLPNGTTAGGKKVVRIDKVDYAFRWCPPGSFKMGSPASEKGRSPNEDQVDVTLTQGFWMLETEVTQAMWTAVIGTKRKYVRTGESYPVSVTWSEQTAFCEKLTDAARRGGAIPEDQSLRLPTEAEWEYACRAGTTTAYSFGEDTSLLRNGGAITSRCG